MGRGTKKVENHCFKSNHYHTIRHTGTFGAGKYHNCSQVLLFVKTLQAAMKSILNTQSFESRVFCLTCVCQAFRFLALMKTVVSTVETLASF